MNHTDFNNYGNARSNKPITSSNTSNVTQSII